jgi:hypothetical protein
MGREPEEPRYSAAVRADESQNISTAESLGRCASCYFYNIRKKSFEKYKD